MREGNNSYLLETEANTEEVERKRQRLLTDRRLSPHRNNYVKDSHHLEERRDIGNEKKKMGGLGGEYESKLMTRNRKRRTIIGHQPRPGGSDIPA